MCVRFVPCWIRLVKLMVNNGEAAYKVLTESIGWVPAVGPWAGWSELTDDLRNRYERFAAVLRSDGWNPGRMPVSLYEQDLEVKLEDADYRREFIAGVSELVRADERDRIVALLKEKCSCWWTAIDEPPCSKCDVIKIIEGENNESVE